MAIEPTAEVADPALAARINEVHEPASQRKIVLACLIGNFMEYFDFSLFGFFAVAIGLNFFPATSTTAALLQSFAVFGVAFAVRPIGGLVFGLLGDRAGRRTSLSVAIVLMGVGTALIAVVPPYAVIGIWAPIVLVLLRCVEGLSIGGEFSGSSAYLIETAPPGKRGVRASMVSLGGGLGLLAGGLFALVLQFVLTADELISWGWRIPFLVAAPIAMVGLYIRRRLEDSPVFLAIAAATPEEERPRWRDAFGREHMRPLFLTLCFSLICGVGYYYFTSFAVNFLSTSGGISRTSAVLVTSIGLLVYVALCPFAGSLSDRFGRRRTIIAAGAGYVLLGIPLFLALSSHSLALVIVAMLLFAVIQSVVNVNTSLLLIELFPARTRLTSASVGFNIAVGPPSGFAPLIGTALAVGTGIVWAPAFYLVGVCLLATIGLVAMLPETKDRSVADERAEALLGVDRPA